MRSNEEEQEGGQMANDTSQMPQPQPQPQPQVAREPVLQYEFKYHAELQAFGDCPPRGNADFGVGYRWCFEDLDDSRNSLPVSLLHPERKKCCSAFALSMFTTLDQAVARFNSLKNKFPAFETRVGTHYVSLRINAEVGRSTLASNDGHFDFFEYTNFRLNNAVIEHLRRPQ